MWIDGFFFFRKLELNIFTKFELVIFYLLSNIMAVPSLIIIMFGNWLLASRDECKIYRLKQLILSIFQDFYLSLALLNIFQSLSPAITFPTHVLVTSCLDLDCPCSVSLFQLGFLETSCYSLYVLFSLILLPVYSTFPI